MADDKKPPGILNNFSGLFGNNNNNNKPSDKPITQQGTTSGVDRFMLAGVEAPAVAALQVFNVNAQKPMTAALQAGTRTLAEAAPNATTRKGIEIAGAASESVLAMSDSMAEFQQRATESARAVGNLFSSVEHSEDVFKQYDSGLGRASKATGESIGNITRDYQELFKASTFLSGGFKSQQDVLTRASQSFDLYSDTVKVARSSGLQFADASELMKESLKTQGTSGQDTVQTISLLKKSIADTGVAMPDAIRQLGQFTKGFEYLDFDANKSAMALGAVAKAQKQLSDEAKYTYKSPQQAIESFGKALSGAAKAQQDFGQALFFTGLKGGGLKEMFSFMTEEDPVKAMQQMTEGLTQMFGGELLTKEKAKSQGREGEFMSQSMIVQEQMGLGSPQEAMKFMGLMSEAQNGNLDALKDLQGMTKDQGKSEAKGAMDSLKLEDQHFKKMFDQTQVTNSLLGQINVGIASMSRTGFRRATELGGATTDFVKKQFGEEAAKAFEAFESKGGDVASKSKKAYDAMVDSISGLTKEKKEELKNLPGAALRGDFKQRMEEGASPESITPTSTKQKTSATSKTKTPSPLDIGPTTPQNELFGQSTGTMLDIQPGAKSGMGMSNRIGGWNAGMSAQSSVGSGILDYKQLREHSAATKSAAEQASQAQSQTQAATPEYYANVNLNLEIDGQTVAKKALPHLKVHFSPASKAEGQLKG